MRAAWIDNLIWISIFVLIVPSGLVVASWNSLPGSRLFRVKLLAEDALVALAVSKGAKSELQVAYADKRLADATQMLVQSESGDGLEYFRKQMEDAKNALSQAPDGSAKEELKAKYLTALQSAQHQLEQQKQIISTAHNLPASTSRAANPREQVVVREVTKVNYVTKVNEVTHVNEVTQVNQVTQVTNVINQITQTQTQITQIIQQVQQNETGTTQEILPTSTPVPTVTPMPTATPVQTATPVPQVSACASRCQSNTDLSLSTCLMWCQLLDNGSKQCPGICDSLEESQDKNRCRRIICQNSD